MLGNRKIRLGKRQTSRVPRGKILLLGQFFRLKNIDFRSIFRVENIAFGSIFRLENIDFYVVGMGMGSRCAPVAVHPGFRHCIRTEKV